MSIWDLTEEDKTNMRRAGWSDQALGFFERKDHLGELEGSDVCHTSRKEDGKAVRFCICVEEGKITYTKYSYQACPAIAATCSAIANSVIDKNVNDVESITTSDIWKILGELPEGHEEEVDFVLKTFKETVKIYMNQKKLTKSQHDNYLHICNLTGRQLEELDSIPCGNCSWLQNCENDHRIV